MHNVFRVNGAIRCRALVATALALVALVPAVETRAQDDAGEDQEARTFVDSLYAKRIQTVQRTRDTDDDLALMKEMLDIAPTLPAEPDARSVLYARIADLAIEAHAGFDVAFEALESLERHNPEHPAISTASRLDLYQAWYRGADRDERDAAALRYFEALVTAADATLERGDHAQAKRWYAEAGSVHRVARLDVEFDLRQKLVETRAVERIQQEIEQLKQGARNGLAPPRARRLVVLLALETGDYEQAATYASFIDDAGFVKGLKAAAALGGNRLSTRDDGEFPPSSAYLAGQWYAQLADEPALSDAAAERALRLARIALHRYIDSTVQESIEKARAAILVRQLDERYKETYGSTAASAINVVEQLDPERHKLSGAGFEVRDGKLYTKNKTIIHLPVEGLDWYALTMEVQFDADRDNGMQLWFPIGDRSARLYADYSDKRTTWFQGLAHLKAPDKPLRFNKETPVVIRLEVRALPDDQAAIGLDFEGRRVWEWKGNMAGLDEPSLPPPNAKTFAVRMETDAVFNRIELERIDREAD